jgi:acetyl-CoA decarbonylase/synthase complex subunit gamma
MPQKISILELYSQLPKKNCKECGYSTCMAFAASILEGKTKLENCPYITEEDRLRVEGLIAAPVAKLTFGKRRPLTIGEARVMHRHELKFYNPTPVAVEVPDSLNEIQISTAIKNALEIKVERLGETYGADAITITCSGETAPYARAVRQVAKSSDLPIILNCPSTEALEAGLEACGKEKPMIFAATRERLDPYVELAKKFNAPLVLADKDLGELRLMAKKASAYGLDIALCPVASSLAEAIRNQITVRRAAIENKILEFGHPIIGIPASLISSVHSPEEFWWRESLVASALLFRYADLIILRYAELETVLPIITLRHGVFSDPKIPAKVKAGLHELGSPRSDSQVLLTVNYALTFYLVSGDIDRAGIDCYLLVAETGGMSVLNALASGQMQSRSIADLIKETDLESKVSHKHLIIPGLAARLRGEIEELSGWQIFVGPAESRDIPQFLKHKPS